MSRHSDTAEGYPEDFIPPDLRRPDPPDDSIDPRFPERVIVETKPEETDTSKIPIRKVSTAGITRDRLSKYGITRDEAAFMRAVVRGMNRELDGYTLLNSMTSIKSKYEDINEDKLIDAGLIKRHTGVARRAYYTVTPDGQKACRTEKKHGFNIGDVGADTPHRVGMELARQYYAGLPNIRRVELSPRENGSRLDLVVVDTDGTRVAVVEVEAGRVSADPHVTEKVSAGINDYEGIRKDYRLLADSDGESVWVTRNHEIVGTVLRSLNAGNDIPVELPRDVVRGVEQGRVKIGELNENHIKPIQADGIDEIVTFQQLRYRLQ